MLLTRATRWHAGDRRMARGKWQGRYFLYTIYLSYTLLKVPNFGQAIKFYGFLIIVNEHRTHESNVLE